MSETEEDRSCECTERVPSSKDHDCECRETFTSSESSFEDTDPLKGKVGTGEATDCSSDRHIEVSEFRHGDTCSVCTAWMLTDRARAQSPWCLVEREPESEDEEDAEVGDRAMEVEDRTEYRDSGQPRDVELGESRRDGVPLPIEE